jgi:molecular chaperone GrpE
VEKSDFANDGKAEADQELEEESTAGNSDDSPVADPEPAWIQQLEDERVQLLGKLARAQADLSNIKRRTEQEIGEVRKFANQIFAAELLRVVDSLDRALGSIPDSLTGFAWIDGLLITRAQVDALLKSQGIEPIDAKGEKFDPRYHEAVSSGESSVATEVAEVLEEYQRGYLIHDRVLRPSLVRAGSAETSDDSNDPDDDPEKISADSEVEADVSSKSE